ncbi:MAG: YncE family protein [Sphingobacteriaceae bacterium]|nr:YncE family protein [Sphingobacteriaceae bacterium]
MKNNIKKVCLVALGAIILSSCKKKDNAPQEVILTTKSVYVLNEGGWKNNNSSISAFENKDMSVIQNDIFKIKNNRDLGDTGNDIGVYGSKMYVVMNGSNTIEVMNASDAKSVKQISMGQSSPRSIAFAKGKAFVCSFDGTVVEIDTLDLAIKRTLQVGRQPQDIVFANNKLYVSNSGSYQPYDNTISVIDVDNLKLIKNITVKENPSNLEVDSQGNIYVGISVTYDSNWAQLTKESVQKIDKNDSVTDFAALAEAEHFTISGNDIYASFPKNVIKKIDLSGKVIVEDYNNSKQDIKKIYGLTYDELSKKLYVCDAKDYVVSGSVFCFSDNGTFVNERKAGILPKKVVFIR